MRKAIILFQFVLFIFYAAGQEPVKNELTVENDPVHQVIQQGRKQIVDEIISGNYQLAQKTLNELKKKVDKKYVILYPREEMLVALATRNFKFLADSARNYESLIENKPMAFIYDDFREAIYAYLLPEIGTISSELEKSSLTQPEKDVIQIYIHFLFSDDISDLNKVINDFEKNHPKTSYTGFLNTLRRLTLKSRINFAAGYSSECVGAKVRDNYFDQLNTFKIEMDGFIRKLYLSLFIGGGFSNAGKDYLIRENNELIKKEGKKISSLKYGFKFGRLIYSGNAVKLYPYISVGGHEINSGELVIQSTDISSPSEIKTGSLFTGAGISSDILLREWKRKQMYDSEIYFFVRPSLGYDRFLTPNDISKQNNFYFSISLGVSIGPRL